MLLPTDATACLRERAFKDEAMPHTACLLRAAISITRDAAVAEDLVQETLLRAWRFFDRFDQGTNCKAWLFRIMLNLSTRVREKRTAESISSIPLDETHAEDHASTNGDFLQQLLIRRAFEALRTTSEQSSTWPSSMDSPAKRSQNCYRCPWER
jgi:RNA polymerase sigma factor (sigma-70 family)